MKKDNDERYIEHEVQLCVNDAKFMHFEKRMDTIENKINWTLGLITSSIVVRVALYWLKSL